MEIVVVTCENGGISITLVSKLSNLEYAGVVMRLSEDPSRFQVFHDRPDDGASVSNDFGMSEVHNATVGVALV